MRGNLTELLSQRNRLGANTALEEPLGGPSTTVSLFCMGVYNATHPLLPPRTSLALVIVPAPLSTVLFVLS